MESVKSEKSESLILSDEERLRFLSSLETTLAEYLTAQKEGDGGVYVVGDRILDALNHILAERNWVVSHTPRRKLEDKGDPEGFVTVKVDYPKVTSKK